MTEDEKLEYAKTKVREKIGFIQHLAAYIICIFGIFLIDHFGCPNVTWWYWPAMGWGIGVIVHFFSIQPFAWKLFGEKMLQKELDKLK